MSITAYQAEVSPGVFKTHYRVNVEAINRYTLKRVQKRQSNISSKTRAEQIARELWSECRESRPDGVNFTRWGELLFRYIDSIFSKERSLQNPNGFSPHVLKTKESLLKHTKPWTDMHFELVTPQFVTDELDKAEAAGMSRSMTNHILKEVKCVFVFALNIGAVKSNAFAGMKMRRMSKKRKQALNHEEARILLAEAKKRKHPYYEIWLLTLSLGLRRSELAGLKWTDIDFAHGLVHLQRQLIPFEGLVPLLKDREDRVVSIPSFLISTLKEMKLRATSEFVIEVKCAHWRDGHQAGVLRKFCREIGLKEVTHHQLRATHITLALVDGVPLGIVKENVGHAKLSTTDQYFRSAGIDMRGQMDGLKVAVPQDKEGVIVPLKAVR